MFISKWSALFLFKFSMTSNAIMSTFERAYILWSISIIHYIERPNNDHQNLYSSKLLFKTRRRHHGFCIT